MFAVVVRLLVKHDRPFLSSQIRKRAILQVNRPRTRKANKKEKERRMPQKRNLGDKKQYPNSRTALWTKRKLRRAPVIIPK